MNRECCICGKEDDEYFMDKILTGGARAKWICTKCRSKGNLEVTKKSASRSTKRRERYESVHKP